MRPRWCSARGVPNGGAARPLPVVALALGDAARRRFGGRAHRRRLQRPRRRGVGRPSATARPRRRKERPRELLPPLLRSHARFQRDYGQRQSGLESHLSRGSLWHRICARQGAAERRRRCRSTRARGTWPPPRGGGARGGRRPRPTRRCWRPSSWQTPSPRSRCASSWRSSSTSTRGRCRSGSRTGGSASASARARRRARRRRPSPATRKTARQCARPRARRRSPRRSPPSSPRPVRARN